MSELDEVPVLVADLESMRNALANAEALSTTLDLQRQLQALSGRPEFSRLTREFNRMKEKAEVYINSQPDEA